MDPEISKFKPLFYENRLLIDFKGTVENFNSCFTWQYTLLNSNIVHPIN